MVVGEHLPEHLILLFRDGLNKEARVLRVVDKTPTLSRTHLFSESTKLPKH